MKSDYHDIFISYASNDALPITPDGVNWIAEFHKSLEIRLAQLLGHTPNIWRDSEHNVGFKGLQEQRIKIIKKSHLFLAIISPSYQNMDSIEMEVKFLRGSPIDKRLRLLKVVKTPIPDSISFRVSSPEYKFFEIDTRNRCLEYRTDLGEELRIKFIKRVIELAHDIFKLLRSLPDPASRPKFPLTFLSYRREGGKFLADDIFSGLVEKGGYEKVFMDRDAIDLGDNFVEGLKGALSKCTVLLVIIDRNWLSEDNMGGRRIDNEKDYVRMEIRTAFERKLMIVPIIDHGAEMPKGDDLPEDIRKLATLNGLQIQSDIGLDFEALTDKLRAQA